MLGNVLPFGAAISLDDLSEDGVLLWSPSAIIVKLSFTDQLIIALMALEQCLVHLLGNLTEFLDSVEVNQEQKLVVFLLRPFGDLFDVVVFSLLFS